MKVQHRERGQMLIMTALELTLLLGFLALAADVGVLFHSKRHMQAAADAAATAGALNDYNVNMGYTTQSDATAALNAASANGYTTGQDGVTVTVNTPPKNGYHESVGYVEVIISKPDPLYFFRALTGNGTTTVAARAVAGDPAGQTGCVNVNKLVLKGSATIQGNNGSLACGIDVQDSIYNNDSGTIIKAAYLHTPSGASEKMPTSPTPTTQGYTPNNDFTNTYMPNPTDAATGPNGSTTICNSSNTYGNPTYNTGLSTDGTLPLGETLKYTDSTGSSVTIPNVVCFAQNVTIGANSQSLTNFGSGFYLFENGATLNGSITFGLDGSGCNASGASSATIGAVMYNWAGAIVQSNGQLGVCGPTGGEYSGIAIMQPSFGTNPSPNTNTLSLQFGMSGNAGTSCSIQDAALNGYIVAPSATVEMHDNGGGLLVTGIIANELEVNSSTLTVCNYNTVNSKTTPLKSIALVE